VAGITALIPARGGSKGVPRKNIATVGGFPLIAYSIAACKMSKEIDRIVVSTDDSEIAAVAREYGADVPFLRPKKYALDSSTDFDVINHFLFKSGYYEGGYDDAPIAYMRPTTPDRSPKEIDRLVKLFMESKQYIKATSARSAHELPESPYKYYQIYENYFKGLFNDYNGIKDYMNLPRQMFPAAYHPNGYIDIVKPQTLAKEKRTFGDKILPLVTDSVLEIDTKEQLEEAEKFFNFGDPPPTLRYLLENSQPLKGVI
tara:strand:- start:518 stop:1291 length:774 start_codon:yes stop_codon:yes gene_type:complete